VVYDTGFPGIIADSTEKENKADLSVLESKLITHSFHAA